MKQPQPSHMGSIFRTIKNLRQLQPCNTHSNISKVCFPPKTMLNNRIHVQQQRILAHYWLDQNSQWLQSGNKKGDRMDPFLFSVPYDAFLWDTIIQVDCPRKKKSTTYTQRKLIKIRWKTSEPEPWLLHTWNSQWSLMHAYLYGDAFVFESRSDIKRLITLLSNHFYSFELEMYIGTGKEYSKTECILFTPPFFLKRPHSTAHWSH